LKSFSISLPILTTIALPFGMDSAMAHFSSDIVSSPPTRNTETIFSQRFLVGAFPPANTRMGRRMRSSLRPSLTEKGLATSICRVRIDIEVQEELLRHADSEQKWAAHSRVVRMVLPWKQ